MLFWALAFEHWVAARTNTQSRKTDRTRENTKRLIMIQTVFHPPLTTPPEGLFIHHGHKCPYNHYTFRAYSILSRTSKSKPGNAFPGLPPDAAHLPGPRSELPSLGSRVQQDRSCRRYVPPASLRLFETCNKVTCWKRDQMVPPFSP